MTIKQSAWTGMVPVDDTALAVTDTRGPGIPIVYLNGSYASQSHWRRVIAEIGSDYRHITYDERARGKSKRSADYSFEACVRDLDAVLKARGVDLPLLVGWSYGAVLGVHWAARNPGRVAGVVAIDGAVRYGITGENARERIRKLFRRMRLLLPLVRPLGLAARMTADQHAEVNIELNEMSQKYRRAGLVTLAPAFHQCQERCVDEAYSRCCASVTESSNVSRHLLRYSSVAA